MRPPDRSPPSLSRGAILRRYSVKILDITIEPFRTHVDRYQNGEPLPRTEVVQTLTTVVTDEGAVGRYLGGHGHGDQDGLDQTSRDYILNRVKPLLVGE